jgi:UDP:flavonoid glycosyltransferase YjiC (YdhE family)
MGAVEGCDLLITGEIVYAAKSVVEKTGIKWVTTSLAPISLFSAHDPNVYPTAEWTEYLRPLPALFHEALFSVMKLTVSHWFEPYRKFRQGLGLDPDHDPIFHGKFSDLLHLVMFSKVLSPPQPDWPKHSTQTGFCFYDGQSLMPGGLAEFLDRGDPPIVFTLGSAAVMDPRDFFDESVKAAQELKQRAVLLYGIYNQPPAGLDENVVAFDYAPFSRLFPRAACVVHQAGVGTTGQVLRAGVPQIAMPFGHDQPDNAARCRRLGVAEIIERNSYNAKTVVDVIRKMLGDPSYRARANEAANIVNSEAGTLAACDAIEAVR